MMEYVRRGDTVIVESISRFARNTRDLLDLVERLTEKHRRIAETIYERHTALSKWLMDLGVSEQTALDDACRIEHDISAESFAAIKEHIKKYSSEEKN